MINRMSKNEWAIILWLILVLVQGVAYLTHPARTVNLLKGMGKWSVIVQEIESEIIP